MQMKSHATDKALVLYDGQCAFCNQSVRWLKRLDWFGRLEFADARHPEAIIAAGAPVEPSRLLEEMHLLTPGEGRVYRGFAAFRWIAWRLPPLWFLAPFMYVPGVPTLGQRLYLWIARNRFQLVPCHGGICTLKSRYQESGIRSQKVDS